MAIRRPYSGPVNMETTRANDFSANIFGYPPITPNTEFIGNGSALGSGVLANRFNPTTSLVANPVLVPIGPALAAATASKSDPEYRERVQRRARRERAERVARRNAKG